MKQFLTLLRNLLRVSWLELIWGLRIQENLIYNFLAPVLAMLLLGMIRTDADYVNVLVPGMIALGVASSSMQGIGAAMAYMRAYGAWRTLQASPVPVWLYFAGMVLSRAVRSVMIAAVMLALGSVLLGFRPEGSMGLLAAAVLLGALVFSSFGWMISYFARSPHAVPGIINTIFLPMVFASNVVFITDGTWLRTLGLFFPLTFLVDLIRQIAAGVQAGASPLRNIAALVAWFVACSAVALFMTSRREEEA